MDERDVSRGAPPSLKQTEQPPQHQLGLLRRRRHRLIVTADAEPGDAETSSPGCPVYPPV